MSVSQIAPVFGLRRQAWGALEGSSEEVPLTLRYALAAHVMGVRPLGSDAPAPKKRIGEGAKRKRG